MKKLILTTIFSVLLLASIEGGWFTSKTEKPDEAERERRLKAEQELAQQRSAKDHWQLTATLCGAGCLVFLIVGTAAGSKAKRDANS